MRIRENKWFYLIILSLIWGSSFILIKKGLSGLQPIHLGALRIVMTTLILALFGFKFMKKTTFVEWKWFAISGFLGSFFPSFLFAIAETEVDSSVASILNSLVPINTILIGSLVFKIPSTRRQLFGVIIGFVGTALLILKGADLNSSQNYLFTGYILLATIMYAFNANIIKNHLQNVPSIKIAFGNFLMIFFPALLILIYTDFFTRDTFEVPNFKIAICYIFILALFGTALAKIFFNKLVQIASPVFASSVTYLMPVIALIWGVIDNEHLNVYQAIGALIIFVGVYLSNKKKKK